MDGIKVIENADGKKYSSFLSGGKIKKLYLPENENEVVRAVEYLTEKNEKFFILGNGTNTLISDDGVGNVMCLKRVKGVEVRGAEIVGRCGETMKSLYRAAERNGLSGLEELSGIPGTLGGALTMNAGAFGAEIGDYVTEITVLHGGIVQKIPKSDLWFSYRDSVVKKKGYVVLSATLRLKRKDKSAWKLYSIKATKSPIAKVPEPNGSRANQTIATIMAMIRRAAQPDSPSLGSTFKKHDLVSAAYYIDALNLKGFSEGGAKVSEKHAGFIINSGGATSRDYKILSDAISDKVKCAFGISLEREIEIIGNI